MLVTNTYPLSEIYDDSTPFIYVDAFCEISLRNEIHDLDNNKYKIKFNIKKCQRMVIIKSCEL